MRITLTIVGYVCCFIRAGLYPSSAQWSLAPYNKLKLSANDRNSVLKLESQLTVTEMSPTVMRPCQGRVPCHPSEF